MTGSLYDDSLTALIGAFVRGRPAGGDRASWVSLVYAGTDRHRFENATVAGGRVPAGSTWFSAACAMAGADALAHANLYTKTTTTYHHKLIELLSTDRPILCFPAKGRAREVAAAVGGTLYSCADRVALHAALDRVWSARHTPPPAVDRVRIAAYSWARQGKTLEAVLMDAERKKVRP